MEIPSQNGFVFSATKQSTDSVSGWHEIRSVENMFALEGWNNVTATCMRHYLSTLHANRGATSNDNDIFFGHMGHSKDVNLHVYQCPKALRTLLHVGHFLLDVYAGGL